MFNYLKNVKKNYYFLFMFFNKKIIFFILFKNLKLSLISLKILMMSFKNSFQNIQIKNNH